MDPASNTDVLLETVAPVQDADPKPEESGREPRQRHQTWREQPELLAHVQVSGCSTGFVKCVVEGARGGQRQGPVVQGPGLHVKGFVERANLLNRPLRTRTVGGVGAGG